MDKKNISERKQKLYEQIAKLEDEVALQLLEEATEAYLSSNKKDILDELSTTQLTRLNEARTQAEKNEVLSNEEIKAKSREWLTK
jgi:hypothetical protein